MTMNSIDTSLFYTFSKKSLKVKLYNLKHTIKFTYPRNIKYKPCCNCGGSGKIAYISDE